MDQHYSPGSQHDRKISRGQEAAIREDLSSTVWTPGVKKEDTRQACPAGALHTWWEQLLLSCSAAPTPLRLLHEVQESMAS